MKCRIWLLAILLMCLCGWMVGCGEGRDVISQPLPPSSGLVLPWPDSSEELSALPRVASAENHRIDFTLSGDDYFLKSDNAIPDTTLHTLHLIAGSQNMSWGIYGFEGLVAESTPFSVAVELSGYTVDCYLGVADYQQNRWQWIDIDSSHSDHYDIPSEWQTVNSEGKSYFAVVVWDDQNQKLANLTLNLEVASPVYGIGFGPYLINLNPKNGDVVSFGQVKNLLEQVAPYTEWVRTHGATKGLEHIPGVAKSLGLSVAMACFLGRNSTVNDEQIASLIDSVIAGNVDIIIVGTEVLEHNYMPPNDLIAYIQQIRDAIRDAGLNIPITTSDTWYQLMVEHPEVMDECDVIMANFYPYWEGVSVDDAMQSLNINYQALVNFCDVRYAELGGKEVIVGEVGWPSDGDAKGEAVPSLDNAATFWLNFVSWAREKEVKYFYFEAYDEAWKADVEPMNVGNHWGLWTETGVLKPEMMRVFNGETVADNWSYTDAGDEDTIEFTYVPPLGSGESLEGIVSGISPADCRIAVYIHVNNWWIKPYDYAPITWINWDGTWVCDIVTGGNDEDADEITAFLIPNDYDPPICLNKPSLPDELWEKCITFATVPRP